MSTPGFSIPTAATAARGSKSTPMGGGGWGDGRRGGDLTAREMLTLKCVYQWMMSQKNKAKFTPLTLSGGSDGDYGIWVWRNAHGASLELTVPMGHRSALIKCLRSENVEIFSGVWNRVLGDWNDVEFKAPVTKGWICAEFGITTGKTLSEAVQQRVRIAMKTLRRTVGSK
ncbi:hypothetical protein RQP54_17770 [Curvibacter sp. APW13]|uniref:hypothetical protein n=1 Tax=Curvibacter sp. APW13 TaxID=3077236 RepID=UPI0028E0794F|nr:hypothetical protein [Curvibacter sp. APW13]MDT8992725.1 hypothetical protein [Curvibacter sp. APW13]